MNDRFICLIRIEIVHNKCRCFLLLLLMAMIGDAWAAEKIKYSKTPFGAFGSQMNDGLSGGGKYEKPVWNLHDRFNMPAWLDLSVEQRTRYETMDANFRGKSTGGDQQIPLQTDVFAQVHLGNFRLGGEFLDARALLIDKGSKVNNTHVDEADFLQGNIAWADQNINFSGIGAEAVVGRQTLNLGSRRLVARNVFRNTINSFTGLKVRVTNYSQWQLTGFITMPVLRYPASSDSILDDLHHWDEEDTHSLFSGGFLEGFDLLEGINGELYLYHLDESDSPKNQTRNRRYFTPGFRIYRKPVSGAVDFQFETMGQFGTVRATTDKTDNKSLNHTAWSQHVDVGYTFDTPWMPRLALEYDYASGDSHPTDGKDERFDPLYGARRFDFGPTGIYGVFARSNINKVGS